MEEQLKAEIVRASRMLWERGWVANHDGNLSARVAPGRFLCTPTAVSKGDVRAEWLIVTDGRGAILEGTRKPFGELGLHLAAYAARPEIGVVVHAHPPTATGFAVAGVEIGHPFAAEAVASLGPRIPVVPYHRPGSPALGEALAAALGEADLVVLDRHGVLTVGASFEQAILRMELLEHLARTALVARQVGDVRPLPSEEVQALAAKGRPSSAASWLSQSVAREERAPVEVQAAATGRPDVRRVVEDALRRVR